MSFHLVLHWRRFAIALHKRVVQSGITVIHDICFPLKHLLPEAEVLHRYLIVAVECARAMHHYHDGSIVSIGWHQDCGRQVYVSRHHRIGHLIENVPCQCCLIGRGYYFFTAAAGTN